MPSFDTVSEVNHHELANAVDQANREVATRFDFKGTNSSFELKDSLITMHTESDFQLQQMYDILCNKLVKRAIDISCLEMADPVIQLKTATQVVTVREGIDTDISRKMVKLIKDSKLKVQASIQGDQLRVTGKKRDDLQKVMALLKEGKFGLPLQFKNFRD
ncbi:MAG: YajQ family cyclic di-GMP-binding protein [Xanthomonadales bacterium]|nr:YajQ family cyclic di-GMP-binding protein [Gammaproteobacteria bacterium]MBT8055063.1 YajQ family cyclic di-GMP-binding protein [Gammaproteobacteria bacterium]NND57622.1 YajQ family cyclic di-GMP-binding protein [Xanthomonadales bacterium]NNK52714.1 YajQ family cyclic di-GMP-binding protein [Xanthomonadales bacterium]